VKEENDEALIKNSTDEPIVCPVDNFMQKSQKSIDIKSKAIKALK